MAKVANFVNGETITHTRLNQIIADIYVRQDHTDFGGFNATNIGQLAFTAGAHLYSYSNNLGINSPLWGPVSPLVVGAPLNNAWTTDISSGSGGILQLTVGGGHPFENKLMMGIRVGDTDSTDGFAWIQAVKPGDAPRRLCLNPFDSSTGTGGVGVGTPSPYSTLSFGTRMTAGTKPAYIALYEEPDGSYFRGIGAGAIGGGLFGVGIFCKLNPSYPATNQASFYVDDNGHIHMPDLPSTNPGAGTKKLWYDPADGNRIKFAP